MEAAGIGGIGRSYNIVMIGGLYFGSIEIEGGCMWQNNKTFI